MPANELCRYRDAALLAFYRLLFILYAEARDPRLDEHRIYRRSYSATGLVDELLADPFHAWPENRSSLWARCIALFEIYDRGLPPIDPWDNIPPRGGDFFRRDTPEGKLLAAAQLSDATVARLLLDLATTAPRRGVGRERVSFRELDIENLGAVYEGLLEFEPRVAAGATLEIRVQGRLFALSPEEAARLCATKSLSLRGPVEWVAGTPAERFHPEGEDEDAEEPDADTEEDGDDEADEDEDDAAEASGETEKGLKKGGVALLVRRIEPGAFHFVSGPGRKGSGSFYTPRPLVQDLVRHALGPIVEGRRVVEIEALRVLDPACGSAHFLVEAMRYLGRELHRAYVREYGSKPPPDFRSTTGQGWDADCNARRGRTGGELGGARLVQAADRGALPLRRGPESDGGDARARGTLDRVGGRRPASHLFRAPRPLRQQPARLLARPARCATRRQGRRPSEGRLRRAAPQGVSRGDGGPERETEAARKLRRLIDQASPEDLAQEGIDPESVEEQSYKERLRREAEAALAGARLLFDLRSASLFVPEIWRDWRGLTHLVTSPQALEEAAQAHSWWPAFEDLQARERFFHWELEFPEVFLGSGTARVRRRARKSSLGQGAAGAA